MVENLNSSLLSCFDLFLSSTGRNEKIKFSLFLSFMLIIFFGVWLPYLAKLSQKIWRTKGMLNMIPMDIITKDQNLKQAFVSGEILQAVK